MTSSLPDSEIVKSLGQGGLRIHTETLPWVSSIALGLFVPFGSGNESASEHGSAHFIEHLVFKGTKRRSARDIALAIERYGGALNAATEKEITSYYCRIDARHLGVALDVLADLCFNATFKSSLVERERNVVIEEIEGGRDDPAQYLFDTFLEALWGNTRMGHSIPGTPATVAKLSRASLVQLYGKHYSPDRMLLTCVGGVEHEAVAKAWGQIAAKRGFKAATKPKALAIPKTVPKYKPQVKVYRRPTEQASILIAFPGIAVGAEGRHAMACLDGILSGGMGGRLFQALRERQGLVYDVVTMHVPYKGTGLYLVEAACNPERVLKVVSGILKELKSLREKPVTSTELKRVQDFLAGSFALSLESPSNRMYRVALSELYLGRFEQPEDVLKGIRRVTPSDVHAFARTLLDPKGLAIGVVVPEEQEKGLEGELKRLQAGG